MAADILKRRAEIYSLQLTAIFGYRFSLVAVVLTFEEAWQVILGRSVTHRKYLNTTPITA